MLGSTVLALRFDFEADAPLAAIEQVDLFCEVDEGCCRLADAGRLLFGSGFVDIVPAEGDAER